MRRQEPIIVNGEEHWLCPKCRKTLPPSSFYKDKRRHNGLKNQCKKCHVEGNVRTRDVDKKMDANRDHMRRARKADPSKFRIREAIASKNRPQNDKTSARNKLNLAVLRGDVTKPSRCERCKRRRKVTGHHHDYERPLVVEWLCYECHGEEHRS